MITKFRGHSLKIQIFLPEMCEICFENKFADLLQVNILYHTNIYLEALDSFLTNVMIILYNPLTENLLYNKFHPSIYSLTIVHY